MFRRHLKLGAQEVAPKGFPSDGDFQNWRDPLRTWLTLPELRVDPPQASAGGWRSPQGPGVSAPQKHTSRNRLPGILVHQAKDPGVNFGSPAPQLPSLPRVGRRTAQTPAVLSSLVLPPLSFAGASPGPSASRRPTPGGKEDYQRGVDREVPSTLGAVLREFLPNRFREFLRHLQEKSEEQPPLKLQSETWPGPEGVRRRPASSASQHQVGLSKHCQDPSRYPSFSSLPDLQGRPSFYKELPLSTENLKTLLRQTPNLGSLRSDSSQYSTVRKTNQHHSAQSSKLKAVLTHSSSGEGPRPRKRCCPFRVRFADETLQDTARRYWERSCAFRQSLLDSETATQPLVSKQVFSNVSKWLESLPGALCPGTRQKTTTNSLWNWDSPSLHTQEPRGRLFDHTSMRGSLPCIHRPTNQRQQGHLKTHLGTQNILEQDGKLPHLWSQKLESFLPKLVLQSVLKQGRPKGYQLLLPSTAPSRAQR